ncbi:hypothetical protein NLJ89_g2324 [Agrocybe chaxingu]|uniref:Nuclear pore complex protein NUP96 C-terminal domain-containing protein n=1 Tax=Agrocybe chaxingu TaxID=84603 RepID=A0A9W8K724_9AGAR|nr:hypothetical protein NLJ89_g2324 [Agrocybe chaxingu]
MLNTTFATDYTFTIILPPPMARFTAYASDSGSDDEQREPQNVAASETPQPVEPVADSESENEESEEEEDASETSSESSEMDEDELVSSPPRRQRRSKDENALVEDDNGDIRYAHEIPAVRVSPPSTGRRSPPITTPIAHADPTIIPWAQHVGVDAQKMHVMQTSFFRMPEEAAALRAMNQPPKTKGPAIRLDLGSKGQSVNRKHSRDSDGDGLRMDSRERASFAHDIDPPIFHPSRKYARVEITSSIASGNEGSYFDAGLALGRSFRVSWGPGGQLLHFGSICSPTSTYNMSSNSSIITLTKLLPTLSPARSETNDAPSPSSLAAKLLQHHLSHTSITRDDAGIPHALPTTLSTSTVPNATRTTSHAPAASSDPLNFSSFVSLFPSTEGSNPAPVFKLGSALFDPMDLHLARAKSNTGVMNGSAITPDLRNRVRVLRRKTALSKWLEEAVKTSVDGDLRTQVNGSNVKYTAADAAFTHLTGHQVSEACSAAADSGYLKLSTLISQAGGDEQFKDDILAQLDIWRSEKLSPGSNSSLTNSENGLVGRGVWRVYKLLGGQLYQEEGEGGGEDDICASLDWKRVFGLYLWYGSSVDASISDVVNAYQRILLLNSRRESDSTSIARPIPKWATKKAGQSSLGASRLGLFIGSTQQENVPDDPLYALIRLHADPALSLSNALNPLSFAPSGLDWGVAMCWHLYIILSRVMRVRDFGDRTDAGVRSSKEKSGSSTKPKPRSSLINGFGSGRGANVSEDGNEATTEDFQVDGHSPTADLLASSYAFELESWGMIQEAAFVLLHIEGGAGREKAIRDLLARSGPKLNDWMTRGLVGSLKLPMSWVDEAKAMYELDCGNVYGAYELYLSAQNWNAAHNLAVLELAPDAIIRKDFDLLRNLFTPFTTASRRDKIEQWLVRGQVVLDYVNIMTRLPKLLEAVTADNEESEAVPDATQAAEIDELTKRVPKIIGILPDALHRSRTSDDRHIAALEEMTKDLLNLVEKAQPLLLSQIQQPTLTVLMVPPKST